MCMKSCVCLGREGGVAWARQLVISSNQSTSNNTVPNDESIFDMLLALCGVLGLTFPGPGDMTLLGGLGAPGSDSDGTETAFCSCPLGLGATPPDAGFPTFLLLNSSKS